MDEPHVAQTVSHFLTKPVRLRDAISQVACCKGLREISGDQLQEVGWLLEQVLPNHFDQAMVKDTPTIAPPAALAVIPADFLFSRENDFQGKIPVFYQAWQAHQLLKEVIDVPPLGRFPLANQGFSVRAEANDPLLLSNGKNKPHRVLFYQGVQFPFLRRKIACLDLDKNLATDYIDMETVHLRFELISWTEIPGLQSGVKVLFSQRADQML